jgi:hypothetical protein
MGVLDGVNTKQGFDDWKYERGSADQGNVNSGQTGVTNTEIILAGESAAQHEAEKKARHSAKIQGFNSMDLRCKIIDLGNACWIHKQFTT